MNEDTCDIEACTVCNVERDDLFADNAASALRHFGVEWRPDIYF